MQSALSAKPTYPHSFWWYLKWFLITLQLVVFCTIVVTVTAGYGIYQQLSKIMPDVNAISSANKAEATRIYAADNTLLAEFKGEQRRFIQIEDLKVYKDWNGQKVFVAGNLINATLSVEDKRFYSHPGMDIRRIAGAALANFRSHDSASQGGSTITEQLAVNIYLTRTKTLSRRLQTALLALQLERRFSKDEILEMYLNEIYYGNRAVGCEAAAQTYFGKSAKDLTIAEAALLAGLPNSPSYLDPFDHFDHAKKRQELVLKRMFENDKINWQQLVDAKADNSLEGEIERAHTQLIARRRQTEKWIAPYFVSYVKSYLQKQLNLTDEQLNKSGLKIYTTLDPKMQEAAESVMRRQLASHGPKLEGALVCIDPWTGHVLAMVGGRDYYNDEQGGQWNRAVQGKRQCGSSFKPYVYATAMEAGYSPDSIVIDKKLVIGKKEIRNDTRRHYGAMTFREALAQSDNVAAVRVLLQVGVKNVVQKAHLMGIESHLNPVPSLALGTSEVSVLEHTSAYGVFATGGLRAEECPVERVEDYAGTTIFVHEHPVHGARVLSEGAAKSMWTMLRYDVTNGTGRRAQIDDVDVVGKTGTTSSNHDVWFMGATKQLVCGVWMGYDKPRDLEGNSAGGAWCAPAWRGFMTQALDIWSQRDNKVEKMVEDARVTDQHKIEAAQDKKIEVRICNESGLLANPGCPSTRIVQYDSKDDVPTRHCDIPAHQGQGENSPTLGEGDSSAPQPGDLGYNDNTADTGDSSTARHDDATSPDDTHGSVPGSDDDTTGAGADNGGKTNDTNGDTGNDDNADAPAREAPTSYRGNRHNTSPHYSQPRVQRDDDSPRVLNDDYDPASTEGGGQVVATICVESGELATQYCPVTAQRFFDPGSVPKHYCHIHRR